MGSCARETVAFSEPTGLSTGIIFFPLNFGSSATSVDFLDPVMSSDKWETLISLSALPAPHTLLLYTLSQVLSTYSHEEVYERRFSTRIF